MITKKEAGRGRPRGRTPQGLETKDFLYQTALRLIREHGYEATTLRDIAREAKVSVGLLYRYFPSKRAVVLALYDERSAMFAKEAARMPPGRWRERSLFALRASLKTLEPERSSLTTLVPLLLSEGDGVFSKGTSFSRLRVQAVFRAAVLEAQDAPNQEVGEALGRLLYLTHLAFLLWWLMDKSPGQRATAGLIDLFERILPAFALALHLSPVRKIILSADALLRDALLDPEAGNEQ